LADSKIMTKYQNIVPVFTKYNVLYLYMGC